MRHINCPVPFAQRLSPIQALTSLHSTPTVLKNAGEFLYVDTQLIGSCIALSIIVSMTRFNPDKL